MLILQVNFAFDRSLLDADALLERYATLTGWSEALLDAGAEGVMVLQRFHHDRIVTRNGVVYVFFNGTAAGALPRIHADVAHVNGLGFPLRTALLRSWLPANTAIVVQDHASGAPGGGHPSRTARRLLMRAVDGFLFTSAGQAEPWRQAGLIAAHQPVYEILEASTRIRPIARDRARALSGVRGAPALLWVGRLNDNKDPLTVLDGLERSLPDLPGAELTMVFSEVDLLPAVERRLALSPELQRRVHLAGTVPHALMPAYYSAADLFVLGSHHEGSGYALLEACACGAVPVVSDIPAFRAIAGGHGARWATGDPEAFAAALIETARRRLPEARAALTAYFAEALAWPAVGRRAMDVYDDVLARRERRAAGRLLTAPQSSSGEP